MRWILSGRSGDRETDLAATQALADHIGIHPLAAKLLCKRGYADAESATEFLSGDLTRLPDPFLLHDMEKAVERLALAISRRERIVAYGDYDVDGVTATAQLVTFLGELGADVHWYVPHRLNEGYGLNLSAVAKLAAEGARLIVTLDSGVTAVSEVEQAAALGVDVIIVDHHQVSPELPKAVAILNPQQPGCAFPDKQLCAAGVTFFLLMALRKRLREKGAFAGRDEPNLKSYLDLVALGTVADVVPLVGANRLLVRAGLLEIARGRRAGLRALCGVAGIPPGRAVTAGQLGYKLGPRINAAGRMNDAGRAVELMLTQDSAEADKIARELDRENLQRRGVESQILEEAMAQAEARLAVEPPRGFVLAAEGWHPGVVGIVASRVAERTGRPAVLLAIEGDLARGSGRSVTGFDLHAALGSSSNLLDRFGGHRAAAGLALQAKNIPEFRRSFEAWAGEKLTDEQVGPRCLVDEPVETRDLGEKLANDLERLAPFGAGNPEPVLAAYGLRAEARLLPAKEPGAEPHLKLQFGAGAPSAVDAIGFGMGGQAELCAGPVDAAFHLGVDEWQGRRRVQLRLRSLRAAEAGGT